MRRNEQRGGSLVVRFGGLRAPAGTGIPDDILDSVTVEGDAITAEGGNPWFTSFTRQLFIENIGTTDWDEENHPTFFWDLTDREPGIAYTLIPSDPAVMFSPGAPLPLVVVRLENPSAGEDAFRVILAKAHRYIFVGPDHEGFNSGAGMPFLLPGNGGPGGAILGWPNPPVPDEESTAGGAFSVDVSAIFLPFPDIEGFPPAGTYWFGLANMLGAASVDLSGYALVNHNHDGTYAPAGDYAPADHNHDGSYAPAGHNHDDAYSQLGHGHSIAEVGGLQTALDSKLGTNDRARPFGFSCRLVDPDLDLEGGSFTDIPLWTAANAYSGTTVSRASRVGMVAYVPEGWGTTTPGFYRITESGPCTLLNPGSGETPVVGFPFIAQHATDTLQNYVLVLNPLSEDGWTATVRYQHVWLNEP